VARPELEIGLTFDLRDDYRDQGLADEDLAEFDRPDTIDAIENALRELGHRTERIGGLRALVARLHEGRRWDLVFNVAEGLHGVGREAQVPALLDAYGIAYTFSDPLVSALTLHKAVAKRVLRDLGLPTAPFALIEDAADASRIELRAPWFAKPVAEGTSKGIDAAAIVHEVEELALVCRRLLERFRQPVLVEEYLPGREFTVGIVGTGAAARSVGVLEVALRDGADPGACTFRNKEDCETLVTYTLVRDELAREAEGLALAAWRGIGCRDAGRVDLRTDDRGALQLLELNPLAGLHPSHSDLPILWQQSGRPYRELIDAIVRSAALRIGRPQRAPCRS
jgi:D-alanine-D-alanine ligase